jgi:dihydroflavonol-4-reductase
VHAASTVKLTARDPQREIVDVAVGGTRNVLAAVAGAHTVRRLVVTSSVAAIVDAARPGHTYSEVDWNETSTLRGSPYPLSKTLAEREAWRIVEAIAPDRRPRLVTLQPVLVLGPILARAHARSSPAVLLDLMRGKFPAAPRLSFGVVDVRDVARAHRLALELDAAQGRYLLHHENLWLLDMARHLAARFPHHPLPRRRLPDPLAYAAALFDRRLSFAFLRTHLGRTLALDTSKVERELGLTFRPVDETLADTAVSFLEHGLVAPR